MRFLRKNIQEQKAQEQNKERLDWFHSHSGIHNTGLTINRKNVDKNKRPANLQFSKSRPSKLSFSDLLIVF
jgi:hypothetical protein